MTGRPPPGELAEWTRQPGALVRLDWGPHGLRALGPVARVIVVVDVLRFTTAVEVAVARGAIVHPYRWRDGTEADFARSIGAELADEGAGTPWNLSPRSLSTVPSGTRLVLPSPNGSALAESAASDHGARVFAGCLRNASAVATAALAAASPDGVIAVIAAGERWRGATGPLRPSVEDLLGAGAIVQALLQLLDTPSQTPSQTPGAISPEAAAAAAAWAAVGDPLQTLLRSVSGQEAIARGWRDDVEFAALHDCSSTVPELLDGAFQSDPGGVGDFAP